MNQTEPLDLSLGADDQKRVALGVEHYCKHLDRQAKGAEDLGRQDERVRYMGEAELLRAELVTPVVERGEPLVVMARHMEVCRRGLEYLVTGMKAAKGPNANVGFDHTVRELDDTIGWIEGALLSEFTEQASLALDEPTPPPDAQPAEGSVNPAEPSPQE